MPQDQERKWLTQEEVNALPDGTLVEVIWCGGNGPHIYKTKRYDGGVTTNAVLLERPGVPKDHVVACLDFVGTEKPYTRVRLAPPR